MRKELQIGTLKSRLSIELLVLPVAFGVFIILSKTMAIIVRVKEALSFTGFFNEINTKGHSSILSSFK
jgi:hypothetical protein